MSPFEAMIGDAAEREGALLCAEGLALLLSSQGDPGAARAVFAAVSQTWPPSARLLREWALFEKRQGRLQVRLCVHHHFRHVDLVIPMACAAAKIVSIKSVELCLFKCIEACAAVKIFQFTGTVALRLR